MSVKHRYRIIEDISKDKLLRHVSDRIWDFIDKNYEGKWSVFAGDLGISTGSVQPWLNKKSLPGALQLARMAALGVDVSWLLTGEKAAEASSAGDTGEVGRLRQDLAVSQSRIEALTNQLAESAQEAARQGRRALDLGKENDRLRAENQALRTRGTAAALSPAEAKLIAEVSGALGVPKDQGLLGALERVRANLASVGALSPPTVHESGSVQKSEGDGDGPEQSDVPPRANSSS